MNKLLRLGGIFLLCAACPAAHAHDWSSSSQMARAAQDLLETLEPQQREAVRFRFEAGERANWSNLPILMVPPSGLLLKDMNDAQRKATQALLRASMSSQGYAKFTGVMRLDDLLHELALARVNENAEDEPSPLQEAIMASRVPPSGAGDWPATMRPLISRFSRGVSPSRRSSWAVRRGSSKPARMLAPWFCRRKVAVESS